MQVAHSGRGRTTRATFDDDVGGRCGFLLFVLGGKRIRRRGCGPPIDHSRAIGPRALGMQQADILRDTIFPGKHDLYWPAPVFFEN